MRIREAVAEGADGDEGAGCAGFFFLIVEKKKVGHERERDGRNRRRRPDDMEESKKKGKTGLSPIASLLALPSEPRKTARTLWMSTDFA